MRAALRWSRRLAMALAAFLVLIVGAVALAFRITLPPGANDAAIPGLIAPVEITLDARGIPWVRAATVEDAWAALGWLHARDRLFQMDMIRRGAAGRLSALIGAPGLRLDRFSRLLGLEAKAERALEALPQDTRAALAAYARGVNAWIESRGLRAAPEYLLLAARPEPWRETDSLLWGEAMALFLTGNMRTELARLRLSTMLERERIDELWPRDGTAPPPVAALPALPDDHLERVLAALPVFGEDAPLPSTASNSWAVTGPESASGTALLANDPHLALVTPTLWHLARVDAPGLTLAGAFAPGVPFLMLGHNGHIAWGFTTTHSDTQDVFIERLAGEDAYLTPDGPRPFTVREEVIEVRFGEPVRLRVRETRNGPVISDLDPVPGTPEGYVFAVAMAMLAPGDAAAVAMHRLNRARDFAAADEAARLIVAPQQNLVIADTSGRIGMLVPGRVPIRRAGDGSFPVRGWDGSHDWLGFAPYEALPRFVDPPTNRLVNANNRIVPDEFPVWLTRDWSADFRYRRIVARLDAHGAPHDAASFATIQMDIVSKAARDLLPHMLRGAPAGGAASRAHALLAAWDGTMAVDRPEPLIYSAWVRAFGRALSLRVLGHDSEALRGTAADFLLFVLTRGGHWCGEGADPCPEPLARALEDAVAELARHFGPDPAQWRWGAAHRVRFPHLLFQFVPGIGGWLGTEIPIPGDGYTVLRAGVRMTGARPFESIHGASFRGVYDLADLDASRFVIAPGQSGHPLSRHYRDFAPLWLAGGHVTLPPRPAAAASTITLRPE